MQSRIIEIADNSRHLALYRGFMTIRGKGDDRDELGRVPLDDINAVIANAHGISYTNSLMVALAERGIPFVLCGDNHNPAGMLWPVAGHHLQAGRMDAQIAAKLPLKKRLWAQIVRAKIVQQAATLKACGLANTPVSALAIKVRVGDPQNIEGQAARRYWPLLFDNSFRRDQQATDHNTQLNYGYMVLRAATARAVIAAGLHPTLGIHHSNQGNPMRLVDDLMEPFRPLIDQRVRHLWRMTQTGVTPESKRFLAQCLYQDLQSSEGRTPVFVCIQRAATSLAQVLMGERKSLELPPPHTAPLTPAQEWDD